MSCCKIRLQSLENISKWRYQDDECVMQGPYDSLLMLKWISQGYFDESTVILEEKFSTKMSLKRALISLKEDAIKHAQSIFQCPHYSNDIYSFGEYDDSNKLHKIESISTATTNEYPNKYRNVPDFDKNVNEEYSTLDDKTICHESTQLANNGELSPCSDKSIVTSSSYYSSKSYELQSLEEAINHLKRIERHKISGYIEKIMCMGSDINYFNSYPG